MTTRQVLLFAAIGLLVALLAGVLGYVVNSNKDSTDSGSPGTSRHAFV